MQTLTCNRNNEQTLIAPETCGSNLVVPIDQILQNLLQYCQIKVALIKLTKLRYKICYTGDQIQI